MASESDKRLETVSRGISTQFWERIVFPKITRPIVVLDEFLNSNTHLFTLIGVFAALTIYFETAAKDISGINYLDNVLFTGFSLVTLLSLIVFLKVIIEIHSSNRGWKSLQNIGLYLFLFFYSQIAIQFAGILLQFETILNVYIFIIVFLTAEAVGAIIGLLTILIPALIGDKIPRFKKPIITILFTAIFYLSVPFLSSMEGQQPYAPDMSTLISVSDISLLFTFFARSFYALILALGALIVYALSAWWVLLYCWKWMKAIYHNYVV